MIENAGSHLQEGDRLAGMGMAGMRGMGEVAEQRVERAELHDYRMAARSWLAKNAPPAQPQSVDDEPSPERIAEVRRFQAKLHEAGYAGFSFPVEFGGQGLTVEHELAFMQEAVGYDIPLRFFGVSIYISGGTLIVCGSREQKLHHIPAILSGAERWLQFLSEPTGGSDLAGLLTSATRDGDSFVVNGQKTWSTGAHLADFALCPVRTRWDVPKYKGISVLIVDLKSPGIEIRRIKQIDGGAEFCEEFFTDLVVPADNLVGEENAGWKVARKLLEIEHGWPGRAWTRRGDSNLDTKDLVGIVEERGLRDDHDIRRRVVSLYVSSVVQTAMLARVSQGVQAGKLPAAYGSIIKMGNDTLVQRRAALALELTGADGVAWGSDYGTDAWSRVFLTSRSRSIAGGTLEIQRNNVSEHVLGLPREMAVDLDVPFSDVPHN